MNLLRKYFHLWWLLSANAFSASLSTRLSAFLFLIGKALRFGFFVVFLLSLFAGTRTIGGYSVYQALLFYFTFSVIDGATQLFFREVYRFRPMVVSGDFDLVLVKPISPLFRVLAGGADPLDLFMLVPQVGALIYVIAKSGTFTWIGMAAYILFMVNALVIATGFHIFVLALAILTTEIDHAILIYRDITSMGRVPVDIYREPLRALLTFVVPVGVMMTFPVKALLGLLSPALIVTSVATSLLFVLLCLRAWRFALARYTSASS